MIEFYHLCLFDVKITRMVAYGLDGKVYGTGMPMLSTIQLVTPIELPLNIRRFFIQFCSAYPRHLCTAEHMQVDAIQSIPHEFDKIVELYEAKFVFSGTMFSYFSSLFPLLSWGTYIDNTSSTP